MKMHYAPSNNNPPQQRQPGKVALALVVIIWGLAVGLLLYRICAGQG